MGKFGTDGVRGVFGEELTTELAYQGFGRYGAYILSEGSHNPKIVIGKDTRISGDPLEKALTDGIISVGGKVVLAGVIPTPAVAVIAREIKADAGIVISASHNPYQFNGIKFFNGAGYKLSDDVENQIEKCIIDQLTINDRTDGSVETLEQPEKIYVEHITKGFACDFSGIRMVLDCANGASYRIAPKFFMEAGADVVVIGHEPNGKNINDGYGSTCLDKLSDHVLSEKADIGIAFDGDADRCLAVDNEGRIIDGDKILHLVGAKLKQEGRLKKDTVVVTVMSNIGLDIAF